MATIFDQLFADLAALGLFEVILPFLLIYAITYGVLARTNILRGTSDVQRVNQLVAFVISFTAIASGQIVQAISVVSVYMTVIMVALISLSVLISLLGFKVEEASASYGAVVLAMLVIFLLFLTDTMGLHQVDTFLDAILPVVFIVGVFVLVVWFITSGEVDVEPSKKEPEKPKPKQESKLSPEDMRDVMQYVAQSAQEGKTNKEVEEGLRKAGFTDEQIQEYQRMMLQEQLRQLGQ